MLIMLIAIGIWRDAMVLLEEYAEKFKGINVVIGPIFDYNSDGLDDSHSEILKYLILFIQISLPVNPHAINGVLAT